MLILIRKFDTTKKYGGIEYASYEQYADFLYTLELNDKKIGPVCILVLSI